MSNLINLKFQESDFAGKDIVSLSDTPSADGMSARELKERFDMIPKIIIAMGHFNRLIDELVNNGAESIGIATKLEEIKADMERIKGLEAPREEAERQRIENEISRIQYEVERVRMEQLRIDNEAERDRQERSRLQGEIERKTYEQARKDNENARIRNENQRDTAERDRRTAEATRQEKEFTRRTNENQRVEAEQRRKAADTARHLQVLEIDGIAKRAEQKADMVLSGEGERVDRETLRQEAERQRQENETTRIESYRQQSTLFENWESKEQQRTQAEEARVQAESSRVREETVRVNNDNYRYSLEVQRQANETVREENRQNFGYRGEWQNGAYKKYNMVGHKGKVYLANQDTSNEPPHADWVLLSSEGKSLRIGGKFDTVSELRAKYPNGDDKMYIVWGKIYAWLGSSWEQMGDFGGSVGIDKAEVIKIITPELAKKVGLTDADYTKLLDIKKSVEYMERHHSEFWESQGFNNFGVIGDLVTYSVKQLDKRVKVDDPTYQKLVASEPLLKQFKEAVAGSVGEEYKFFLSLNKLAIATEYNSFDAGETGTLLKYVLANLEEKNYENIKKVGESLAKVEKQARDGKHLIETELYYTIGKITEVVKTQYPEASQWTQKIVAFQDMLVELARKEYLPVVNDLTTGGTDKALSAEQGKILFQNVDNGKSLVANAIIGKGGKGVTKDSTFEQLATAIENLDRDGEFVLRKFLVEGRENLKLQSVITNFSSSLAPFKDQFKTAMGGDYGRIANRYRRVILIALKLQENSGRFELEWVSHPGDEDALFSIVPNDSIGIAKPLRPKSTSWDGFIAEISPHKIIDLYYEGEFKYLYPALRTKSGSQLLIFTS